MKQIDPFARTLCAALATGMLMIAPPLRAENKPQVIQVIRVEGKAQWSRDSKSWTTLNAGDVLKPGSVIRTADKSLVDVVLGDSETVGAIPVSMFTPGTISSGAGGGGGGGDEVSGNVIRIFSSTVLGVDKLIVDRTGVDEVSDTQLDLRAGQIFANVKKMSKQSRYEVKIPNGVAGIRGTGVLISSVGIIETYSGDVIVSIISGTGSQITSEVPSGHRFDPGTGQVTEMSPGDLNKLQLIFNDLSFFIKTSDKDHDKDKDKDHTHHFYSDLDGTEKGK